MRIVLDTNVFVSGVFFGGPPSRILAAWRTGRVTPVVSAEILGEYRRVGQILASRFPEIDLEPFLTLLVTHAEVALAPPLPEQICDDPDDDKFLACAIAARARIVVSGDRALGRVSGFRGGEVLTPRRFIEEFLAER